MTKHSEDSTCVGVAVESVYENAASAGESVTFRSTDGAAMVWGRSIDELAMQWVEDGTSPCFCD